MGVNALGLHFVVAVAVAFACFSQVFRFLKPFSQRDEMQTQISLGKVSKKQKKKLRKLNRDSLSSAQLAEGRVFVLEFKFK